MQHPASKLARGALISASYLAFACRLMIPAGYMPAALGDGGPVTLCPMGLPAGLLSGHSGHHRGDDGRGSGSDLAWEYCPVGSLFDTASVIPETLLQLPIFRHASPASLEPTGIVAVPRLGFRPRAPPLFLA